MKRFLLRCALVFTIVLVILVISGIAYKHTNHYYNLERMEETEKFHTVPPKIDIAVFGASHGRSDFAFFPPACVPFNFSMGSQTPAYDEKMMLEFGNRFHSGTLVILTIGYTSPFFTENTEEFDAKQARYYRILSAKNIINVDSKQYYLQKLSPLLTTNVTDVVAAFFKNEELADYDGSNRVLTEDMLGGERERIKHDHYEASIRDYYPEGSPTMMGAYHRMITLCKENGWSAVLVTPPVSLAYNECFPVEYYNALYARIQELTEEYDVPYFDYSHDARFEAEYDLFRDIDHLNANGAEKFDEIFFKDLKNNGIIE